MWFYGSGFPKSHDVSKGIDKTNGEHPSRGNCREGRPVTARKQTLSRSQAARARAE
jgi:hypothetical protein